MGLSLESYQVVIKYAPHEGGRVGCTIGSKIPTNKEVGKEKLLDGRVK